MNNFKEQLSKETSCIDNIIEKYLPEAKGHAEYIKSAMVTAWKLAARE